MNKTAHQPLRVYSVVVGAETEDRWVDIGAALPHPDGNGFSVVLDALPLSPNLVLRESAEEEHKSESEPASYSQHVAAFERALIERCLAETGGNIGGVMKRLAIPRRTLSEKMARLGIERRRFVRPSGSRRGGPTDRGNPA